MSISNDHDQGTLEKQALDLHVSSNDEFRDSETGEVYVSKGADSELHRRLDSRHLFMISIGSSIGMGLWLGSGASLATGGPVSMWIGYWIAGSIAWALNQSIGEMSTLYPVAASFPRWTMELWDPALAFALSFNMWFSYAITIPNELSGLVTVFEFWTTKVNPAVWISIFLVVLIVINVFAVNVFAESETIMSTIKFLWIIVVIVSCIVITAGGGPKGGSIGFRYWRKDPCLNGFKGFLSVLPNAVFSMSGVELCGIAAVECRNPKISIPKAVNSIWIRLSFFYIVGSLMVTLCVDPHSDDLFGGSGVNASPFVIAFRNAGLPGLGHAHNVIILISVLSSGNASMYGGPRMLVGMAQMKMAPAIFAKCDKKGRPWYGLLATTLLGGGLAYLNVDNTGATVFGWFSNLISLCTLFIWGCVFLTNLRMRYAWKLQGRSLSELPWVSRSVPWCALYGLVWVFLLIVIEFYLAVWPMGETPSAKNFFSLYVSCVLFIACYVGAKIYYRGPIWKNSATVDLDAGRRFYGPEDDIPERSLKQWVKDEVYDFEKGVKEDLP